MFSVKIFNKDNNDSNEFTKTVNSVVSYIFDKLNFNKPRMISDNNCVEIVSGKEAVDKGDIVVELIIRKHIIIDSQDLNDRAKLDRHISKIKHFCDQAKNIEELKYLPINMR